ncbi:ArsR/SmtB family transcription factor [Caloranaerobacter azorensis]|uniref:Winged helix-turn-helix transcriptional regulator n=1 Tax=Caloranaerobacter azorensis TaxID=116090 RepID=A0A6P1YFV3_9FIRM|nr:winged helix-turn-helix transcriptional regulator [Caloranaerobacter azorensis]
MKEIANQIEELTKKADILKAIAHPIRLCIVKGLLDEEGCNVTKMQSCLNMPQSTISQHLAKLKAAGVVEGRRHGVEIKYYLVNEDVRKILKVIF